jgi:hypothetical protein
VIRGIFYIEAQGKVESAVKNALEELVGQIKNEDKVRVERETFEKVLREGDNYSSVTEVDALFDDFLTYLLTAIKYGPSAIIVSEPEKLILRREELLQALGEVIRITKDFFEEYDIKYKFLQEGAEKKEAKLSQEQIEGLLEDGVLWIKLVVEAKHESEEKAVKSLLNAFEENIIVNKIKTKPLSKLKGFEGLIGVEAFVYRPKDIFDLAVKHRPVLIELIEPEKVELDTLDIQDIGVDLAGVFFEASHKLILK